MSLEEPCPIVAHAHSTICSGSTICPISMEWGNAGRCGRIRTVTMSFTMASLLVHSDSVPAAARNALRAAHEGASERRLELLEAAAQILHREMGVTCPDARELVDLQPADCVG